MNIAHSLKKLIPHLSAVIIFLLIGFIYFQPVLEGKQLRKGDTINALGYKKEIADFRKTSGEDPLWTNSMFGGMPAYQITVKYKSAFMGHFKKLMELHTPSPVKYLFLYMIGFYILLISLRVNPWLSIAGAIAYAFSTYFIIIIGAGHIWKVNALAFIPPILGAILMCFRGRYIWGGIMAAFFLILEVYSNHIQMTYYFAMAVLCIAIFEFYFRYKNKQLKQFFTAIGVLCCAAILALGVNSSNLYGTYKYSKETIRGKSDLVHENSKNQTSGLDKDYATQWSYGLEETVTLLIPNAKGGAGSPQEAMQLLNYVNSGQVKSVDDYYEMEQVDNHHYWGNQPFTAGPVYLGAFIVFLFFLGLFIVKGRLKWGLLTAIILSILLSWGHNFMALTDLFLHYFPLYNKFRVVSSILIIVELCVPLLAILAVKKLIEEPNIILKNTDFKYFKAKTIILPFVLTGGLCLILYLLPETFLTFSSDIELNYFSQIKQSNPQALGFINDFVSDLSQARISYFRADALRSFAFIAAGLMAILAFSKQLINKNILIGLVIIITIVDLWPVNKRFVNDNNFVDAKELKVAFNPSQADFEILRSEVDENSDLIPKIEA